MFELSRVATMIAVGVLGVVIAGVGVAAGSRAWVAIVVGAGMVVVAALVLALDPPWRNPYRPDWSDLTVDAAL